MIITPDDGAAEGLAGVEGEVVGAVHFNGNGTIWPLQRNVQAEEAIVRHMLEGVCDPHVLQGLRDIYLEAAD